MQPACQTVPSTSFPFPYWGIGKKPSAYLVPKYFKAYSENVRSFLSSEVSDIAALKMWPQGRWQRQAISECQDSQASTVRLTLSKTK